MKLHGGPCVRSKCLSLVGATIVQPHARLEFHKRVPLGQRVADQRIRMRADAISHRFARNAQCLALRVLSHKCLAPTGGGRLPFYRRQFRCLALGIEQHWLGPVGPVTTQSITGPGNRKMDLGCPADVCL